MAEELPSELLRYLADCDHSLNSRLPALKELAQQMGISIGKLREQLEVARAMGLVDVRPKTGIRLRSYSFAPFLEVSLQFALAINPAYFNDFSILRNHVEAAFWDEAVRLLTVEDKKHLQELIDKAWEKLHSGLIPHEEHCDLHLTIYSRLQNTFVRGILEVFWVGYKAVGLNTYEDYSYLEEVWRYHEQMVNAILNGDYDAGHKALVEHMGLLRSRPKIRHLHPPEVPPSPKSLC